jgi:hypothetical protein
MAVEARFYVAEVTKQAYGGYAPPAPAGRVKLGPSTRGDENKKWASATPSGSIEMTVIGSALAWFEERLGKDIRILMDDAPEPDQTAV